MLKFTWNHKRTWNVKEILRKKEQSWNYNSPWHQTILKSYSNQNSVTLAQKQTHRSVEQMREHRNKSMYLWSIYDKGVKNIQWRKDSVFNKRCWEKWSTTCRTMKLEHSLTLHTKINSKWFRGLSVRHESLNQLEDNISRIFFYINCNDIFLGQFPKVLTSSEKKKEKLINEI